MTAYYDLKKLENICEELCFQYLRASEEVLEVHFTDKIIMEFANLIEEENTYIGFKGLSWHMHGLRLYLPVNNYDFEFDYLDLLLLFRTGELVIYEKYSNDLLQYRWVDHKEAMPDLSDIKEGDELHILPFVQRL